jgi:hypothetical protein
MKHNFFKYVDWKSVEGRNLPTPWKPKLEEPKSDNIGTDIFFKGKYKLPSEYEFEFISF